MDKLGGGNPLGMIMGLLGGAGGGGKGGDPMSMIMGMAKKFMPMLEGLMGGGGKGGGGAGGGGDPLGMFKDMFTGGGGAGGAGGGGMPNITGE